MSGELLTYQNSSFLILHSSFFILHFPSASVHLQIRRYNDVSKKSVKLTNVGNNVKKQ